MPNDKYEDEIRDILNRMDNFVPEDGQAPRREPPRPRQPSPLSIWAANLRRRLATFDSTSMIVGCIVLALAAGILHKIFPPFGALAGLASAACLLGAILVPMFSRRYGRADRHWRGRVIDYQPVRMRQPFSWRYLWWRIKRFFRP